jgi:hypothetical protein
MEMEVGLMSQHSSTAFCFSSNDDDDLMMGAAVGRLLW